MIFRNMRREVKLIIEREGKKAKINYQGLI